MIFSGSSSSAYASLSTPIAGLSAATGLSCSARSRWEPRRLFRRKSFWAAIRSSSSRRRRSCSCLNRTKISELVFNPPKVFKLFKASQRFCKTRLFLHVERVGVYQVVAAATVGNFSVATVVGNHRRGLKSICSLFPNSLDSPIYYKVFVALGHCWSLQSLEVFKKFQISF